ncbi:MAG TPA: class I SAM-dependent methyltransferase [Solirubrobacteraceae bacterium]|jgi:SAM-dependent methyltransferase|nr:class I SAM-dependent methyltransferase [Solirubrobacteraceae bacterium]
MPDAPYDALAEVYDWLVPDELMTPQGSVAAFGDVVRVLEPDARVLDCAAGTGQLAVGLARRGFDVVATDRSGAMVARTRALAAEHGAAVRALKLAWDELAGAGWQGVFAAVFCVGNSLVHAAGVAARRDALAAMAGVLRRGGLLVVTSRNWERLRDAGWRLEVGERLVERHGTTGLPIHAWTSTGDWDERHEADVAVALLDGGAVTTRGERLALWPFTHEALHEDLAAAGLRPERSTYAPDAERYLVTARR